MPPIIRPLTLEDHAVWLQLWRAYLVACSEQGIAVPPAECTELNWSRLIADNEPVSGFVAEVDGTVVGFMHLIFHPSTFHANPVCFLQDLFTCSSHRRQGIAKALIAKACSEAAAKGAGRVYWQTAQNNTMAIALYEGLATRANTVNFRISL